MKTWYIYAHYTLDTNECFYIGVGTNNRAYTKNNRNEYWHNIVNKHDYTTEIIKDGFIDREVAVKKEVMLQLFFKPRACLQYGDNKAKVVSRETKRKLSISKIGKNNPNFNKSPSKETKIKLSKSNLGKKRSNATKQKIAISKSGKNNYAYGKTAHNAKKVVNCKGQIFSSAKEAEDFFNLKTKGHILNCCKGKRKSCGKYSDGSKVKWSFYEY